MITMATTALLLAFTLVLPGWTWTVSGSSPARHDPAALWRTALSALAVSLAILLPLCLILAWLNRFHLGLLLPILGLVACAGALLDYATRRGDALRHLGKGVMVCLLFAIPLGLLGVIPFFSNWIVGGWDPGVIMNQGLFIGRTGEMHPAPGVLAPLWAADHEGLFSRTLSGLREVFPGIPVDPETGAWKFYFFPVTPLMVALLYQMGDIAMATRAPLIIGVLAVLLFGGITGRWFVPLLFLLQPILIYHLRIPTSEITELLILGAFLLLWTHAAPNGIRRTAGAVLLCMAVINRVSFELFGAWLILLVACIDAGREDRRATALDHAALIAGLMLGMAYYTFVSPESLAKLGHIMPASRLSTTSMYLASPCSLAVLSQRIAKGFARRWGAVYTPI